MTNPDTPPEPPEPPPAHPAPGGLGLGAIGAMLNGHHGNEEVAGVRELQDVVGGLGAEGASLHPDIRRALELCSAMSRCLAEQTGDIAGVIANVSLEHLDGHRLAEIVRIAAVDRLAQDEHRVAAIIAWTLRARAVNTLAATAPDVLAPLVPGFRAALADVERAVNAGLTAESGPAEVLDLGDDAVAAWRALVAPDGGVGRLNRLWTLRCRLVRVVGCHVPPPAPPTPAVDPLVERLRAIQGQVFEERADTPPPGVPDGFARHGRAAWMRAVAASPDVVAEFARPALVAARRHDTDPRWTVPADAPTEWDIQMAEFGSRPGGRVVAEPESDIEFIGAVR